MKFKITISAIILLQVILQHGTAQNNELKFNLVEGLNGKPLGKINAITQDPHGYMWFLGQDEHCVYRYDGNRMISFRHDEANPNSLGMTLLETVYADDAGIIWVGGNGLDQYNPATGIFKHYRHVQNDSSSLSIGNVAVILRDHQGRLWVGTTNGLDRFDEKTGKFIHYRNEPGNPRSLSSNAVRTVYEDRRGVLWIGTGFYWEDNNNEGGLNRFDRNTGTFTRYLNEPNNPHSLINNKVRAIFEDSRGIFWVGTSGDGLHTMDRDKGSFERHVYNPAKPEELSRPKLKPGSYGDADHITFINEDSTGAIWIGTYAAGINRYDPITKKITHYQSGNGFPDSTCWNGFISHDGVLWISTENSNLLFRVDPFHKSIYNTSTVNRALSFLEDRKGYLWVGTGGNGLLKYDQHRNLIKQYKNDPSNPFSLIDNRVLSLFQNQEDIIWVGTSKGVRTLNSATQQFSRIPNGLNLKDSAENSFVTIFQDKQGLMWFGRHGRGLISYNPKDSSFKYFYAEDSSSISTNTITTILEDRSGILWVGGYEEGGINRLNRETGSFKQFMAGLGIYNLYEDSGGSLWVGTDKGLFSYNQNEDRFVGYFDPLAEINSFDITGIIEDNSKDLWLKSVSAIIKLNPITKETFIYGSRFGISPNSMQSFGGSAKGIYKNKQGQLYIGYEKGFYTFSPEELAIKTDFKIIITDFFVNTLPVLPGKGSLLQKSVEELSDLDLKYNQNNIAFNFAAIDYREPETIKYFTMLEGYDNTWREAKAENSSYYFNLSRGKYIYRIKAFNLDGTKAEKVITIHINPPWWETWWAYTLYALLLIVAVSSFIKWRTGVLKKEKIILEEKVTERTKELKEEKAIVESTLTELKSTQAQLIQSEKMASLGELTAGIAHEIQNPLNFVNNFSEVNNELIKELKGERLRVKGERNENLEEELLNDISENSEKINQHGQRASNIVKGMLEHSRKSSGLKEPTDINAICDEYIKLSYQSMRAKDQSFNCDIKLELDPLLPKVYVVAQDISRVLLNLVNNAFYAVNIACLSRNSMENMRGLSVAAGLSEVNDYKPEVTVTTKKLDNQIEIKVSDNGNGIPENLKDKIFQPFFTTKPAGQGTGLGLSLSYDIIKAHGGTITVNSNYCPPGGVIKVETKESEGTEFIIQLPFKENT